MRAESPPVSVLAVGLARSRLGLSAGRYAGGRDNRARLTTVVMSGYTLQYAASCRRRAEIARRDSVEIMKRAVRAHAELGATEIVRQLESSGWRLSRSQVNNLLRGRTR